MSCNAPKSFMEVDY